MCYKDFGFRRLFLNELNYDEIFICTLLMMNFRLQFEMKGEKKKVERLKVNGILTSFKILLNLFRLIKILRREFPRKIIKNTKRIDKIKFQRKLVESQN